MRNKLILGTVQLGLPYGINNLLGKPDRQEAMLILDDAKRAGIDTLDTAKAYGSSMELIGRYHRDSGFMFRVISKFHAGNAELEREIKNELSLLAIKHFEAYLFHSFQDFDAVSPATVKTILCLKQEGLIRKVGVSVYGNDQFEKAIHSSMADIIQLPYNLLDNDAQRGTLIKTAKSKGKELHVRSVFLQGLFFMEEERIPEKIRALKPYLKQIKELAEAERLTLQELALGYVLRNKAIDKVLIGVESAAQLKANLQAAERAAALSDEAIQYINTIRVSETDLLSPVNWN